MNNYINKLSCWLKNKEIICRVLLCGIRYYHISIANREDPDQAALTRAARSGSALFAKALKVKS